jgi:GNAT superfamily N-acetyltransferase
MAGAVRGWFFEQNGCYVRLVALVTKEGYRKQGIGSALTSAVEDWALNIGARAIVLNCGNRPERATAHSFYNKLGYTARSTGYSKTL